MSSADVAPTDAPPTSRAGGRPDLPATVPAGSGPPGSAAVGAASTGSAAGVVPDPTSSDRDHGRLAAQAATADQLADHLTALSDHEVAAFLTARPDLPTPASSSFSALAARAQGRTSVDAALAELDAPTLAVAEAVVVLAPLTSAPGSEGDEVASLAALLDAPPDDVAERLAHLTSLALVVGGLPVAGMVETLGPYPAGLGPATPTSPLLPPPMEDLRNAPDGLAPEAVRMLEALTWGPPVGTLRPGTHSPGADALVERGWLVHASQADGRTRLVLPRQVGLALRGGRLSREPLAAPDPTTLDVLSADAVAAESARAAAELVRLTHQLLRDWDREAAPILRTGGVGVRALARTADALDAEPATAATVVEMAAGADLLALDEPGTAWLPSRASTPWASARLPEAWAPIAAGWSASMRTAWLVGTRGEAGTLRAVLSADLDRAWALTLRRRVLTLLASLPEGTSVTPTFVRSALTHARPRRPVPESAVTAVLAEAALLGVTGGGALSAAGRALAETLGLAPRPDAAPPAEPPAAATRPIGEHPSLGIGAGHPRTAAPTDPTDAATISDLLTALEDALAADLPAPVDLLLVQSDLTAVVPGSPTDRLSTLLESSTVVESRGSALTVRFTPDSVRAALDAGMGADALLDALGRHAMGPLPSALTALVRDQARRHGAIRVRAVHCALTVADPALAAGLLADPALAELHLDEVAPGVLLSERTPGEVLRRLREHGLAPVLQDAGGRLILTGPGASSPRQLPAPSHPGSVEPVRVRRSGSRELAGLVGRLRAGQESLRAAGQDGSTAATDPVRSLALLRQAQVAGSRVRLRLAGPDGAVQERRVRVLAVEPGRVRLSDVVRETELTVAVHRIVAVVQDDSA